MNKKSKTLSLKIIFLPISRIEDVSYSNGPQNLSINSSNLKSNSNKQSKFNKQIKESIDANKNANLNLPNANLDLKMQVKKLFQSLKKIINEQQEINYIVEIKFTRNSWLKIVK